MSITQPLSPIDAELLILTLNKPGVAQTKVGPVCVDASSVQTDGFVFALIPVVALVGFGVSGLSFRTLAREGPN